MSEFIVRILCNDLRFSLELGRNGPLNRAPERQLIEIHLKTIGFEQILVIGKVVVALVVRFAIETFYQEAPPAIAVSKIDGPVHRFHSATGKPFPALVKKRERRLAVVDALEKPHTASRLVVAFHNSLLVDKSSDPADCLSRIALTLLAYAITRPESFVPLQIETTLDVVVQWPDPARRILVKPHRQQQKIPHVLSCANLR